MIFCKISIVFLSLGNIIPTDENISLSFSFYVNLDRTQNTTRLDFSIFISLNAYSKLSSRSSATPTPKVKKTLLVPDSTGS